MAHIGDIVVLVEHHWWSFPVSEGHSDPHFMSAHVKLRQGNLLLTAKSMRALGSYLLFETS